MDFDHCDTYNHLLTRTCICGGKPEMIIDFVDDFVARCSKCHRSTHAYIRPEDAAQHWNDGDDIMDHPLHIFWDDPEGYLQGEVVAIHIPDNSFWPISHQSCDFDEAIFEYKDKIYSFKHERIKENGAIDIGALSSFNAEMFNHIVKPANDEIIRYDKIIYSESGNIEGIAFRWSDTWLFVFVDEYNLVLTRSSFDFSNPDGCPKASVEPTLFSQNKPQW